jgi:hypothetical protein
MTRVSILLIFAAALPAAETIGGPVAGYVAGAAKAELRAIAGVPGSFGYSDPLPMPEGTTRVRVAPGQDFALAEQQDAAPAALVFSAGNVDHVTVLEGVMPAADWVAFSNGARSAVLFSAGNSRLQVVTGLPDAVRVLMDLDPSALPETPTSAAVSDDGNLVLVASTQSVFVLQPGQAPRLVFSGTRIRSVAVMRNGVDAAVADDGAGSVHLLSTPATAPSSRVLASGLYLLGEMCPSADGATLFVARPGARTISWIDLASGGVDSIGTDVPFSAFTPLRNRDTFLISAKPGQPGWVFYRDGGAGRVVFIPAAVRKTKGSVE